MIDKIIIKFHNKNVTLDLNTEIKIWALPISPIKIEESLREFLLCYDTQAKPIYGSNGYLNDDLFKLNLVSIGFSFREIISNCLTTCF